MKDNSSGQKGMAMVASVPPPPQKHANGGGNGQGGTDPGGGPPADNSTIAVASDPASPMGPGDFRRTPSATATQVYRQIFLDGYFDAWAGQGEIKLRLPDGSTAASTCILGARDGRDVPNILLSNAVETFPDGRALIHVTWANSTASPISIDYKIVPA